MEDVHSVDVSWLHHSSSRDHHHRTHAPSSPGLAKDTPPRTSAHGSHTPQQRPPSKPNGTAPLPSPSAVSSPTVTRTSPKRPTLLGRSSGPDNKPSSRRNSWLNSISSKFSSAQTIHQTAQGSPSQPQSTDGVNGGTATTLNGAGNGSQSLAGPVVEEDEPLEPYVPQPPKGSFISNALRRLSSGSQAAPFGRVAPHGGMCGRRVLNIDPNRPRCFIPELKDNKLKRVAFCVDVEIAGGPRYKDEPDCDEKKKRKKERKLKERGEGEALKHPELVAEEKEKGGVVEVSKEIVGNEEAPNPEGTVVQEEKKEPNRKKEKKKRSEAERKERKERKLRRAQENGSVPLELTRDADEETQPESTPAPSGDSTPNHAPRSARPTTDPLRIYKRCCSLRETPVIKRINDQLAAPSTCAVASPGVVTCLDLTTSRLQFADIATLGDWLAIVPVKKVILENADLDDEKVRIILCGLLAAKIPEGPARHSQAKDEASVEERPGIVEKLVLKNNPKITRRGWKDISYFVYMCRSLNALDVSMIPFPSTPERQATQTSDRTPKANAPNGSYANGSLAPFEISEVFYKAISERLGGSHLQELLMAECKLKSHHIRKVVDGAIMCGIKRLSLASNDIDNEGLSYILHYIRSGACEGIDLGGTDLRDGMLRLCESISERTPLWALSIADCNLTPESLKPLFPVLVRLHNFRFLDLSHNKTLFASPQPIALSLLRKYLPQLKELKRLHLLETGLSPAGAIGIAEILPECPELAQINMLENADITALASASDESSQEEACALYASLMVACRVSHTLVRLDVDVPGPQAGELVQAMSKQIAAYCLRNMGRMPEVPELSGTEKEAHVPENIMRLVGHIDGLEGVEQDHMDDPPAPDQDYIVGGTGVVKALNYCLLQKVSEMRRTSIPATGTSTPRSSIQIDGEAAKAKAMSKSLLVSARNIRSRIQPALVREAKAGNEIAYRRLLFLDHTLQGMIQRFEAEYPECRVAPTQSTDASSTHSSVPSTSPPPSSVPSQMTAPSDFVVGDSDEDEPKALRSRHNSDVSLASRALSVEEGRIHRLGQRIRADVLQASASRPSSSSSSNASSSFPSDIPDPSHHDTGRILEDHELPEHLLALRRKLEEYSGEELRHMAETAGWEEVFNRISQNADDLRRLEKENPEEFKLFREAQLAAIRNAQSEKQQDLNHRRKVSDDVAVED